MSQSGRETDRLPASDQRPRLSTFQVPTGSQAPKTPRGVFRFHKACQVHGARLSLKKMAMRVLFFQFRGESDVREKEYDNVLRFSGLQKDELLSLFGSKMKPDPNLFDGADAIVFGATGSNSITTEPSDRLEPWIRFLREARARHIPMIGFNYGAQLMTLAFGGAVTRDEYRKEIGSRTVERTAEAKEDLLFRFFPDTFVVQVAHTDRMEELPPGARLLLTSDSWKHECWGFPGEAIYACEFQLDLDEESLAGRLIDYQTFYVKDPGELEHAILSIKPSPESPKILRAFFQDVVSKEPSHSV